jgi:hypothetical protein
VRHDTVCLISAADDATMTPHAFAELAGALKYVLDGGAKGSGIGV